MTRKIAVLATVLAAALQAAPARAVVPQVMTYSGYLKTSGGVAVTAPTNLTFRLYTAASGGTPVWTETLSATPSSDGWFSVVLGTTAALPFASLGGELFLGIEVAIEGEFPQRARLTPSYAAITVDWSGVANRPSACAAGQFLTGYDAAGAALCATPAGGGTGGVASVTGSGAISATGTTAVTVSLTGCSAANQILQWNGTTWGCINTPAPGSGGVTQVQASSPLVVTGTTANPIIGLPTICAPNQILKWNGTVWGCANDADTVNPGTVTSVAPAGTAGNPIAVANGTGAATIDIPPASAGVSGYLRGTDFSAFAAKITAPGGCTDGQVVKWQAAPAPGAFVCAADAVNAGTVTGVTASAPLVSSGGAAPAISMPAAASGADGYLRGADWTTFSNKVSSVVAGSFIQTSTGVNPRVGLQPCPVGGNIPKWDASTSTWNCAPDADSGGTLFAIQVAGGALAVDGGVPGAPIISLARAGVGSDGYLTAFDWDRFDRKLTPPTSPCPGGFVLTWTATGASCTSIAQPVHVPVPLSELQNAGVGAAATAVGMGPFVAPRAWLVSGGPLVAVTGTVVVPNGAAPTLRLSLYNPDPPTSSYNVFVATSGIVAGQPPPDTRLSGSPVAVTIPGQRTAVVSLPMAAANLQVANTGCLPTCPVAGAGDLLWFSIGTQGGGATYAILAVEFVF